MRTIIVWIVNCVLGLISNYTWAAQQPNTNNTTETQPKQIILYCPLPEELTRDGPWWRVNDIWKSYDQSLVEEIQQFSGAQWIGVKVGKIICLYKGKEKLTFPVALEPVHPILVPDPAGPNWITTEEGYKKCISDDVKDCPFTQQKPANVSNVYEQIKYKMKRAGEQ